MPDVRAYQSKTFNLSNFACGNAALDKYLKQRASQDNRENLARLFIYSEGSEVYGYYTLSSYTLTNDEAKNITKSKYPTIPTMLLGRLAIDQKYHRQGHGHILMEHVFDNYMEARKLMGMVGLVVEAIDDNAVKFYEQYDFEPLPDNPYKLILMDQDIVEAYRELTSQSVQ